MSVLNVDRSGTALLVANEQFAVALVHADRSDFRLGDAAENVEQGTVRGVPNLNALGMSRDKGIEDWIVKDANTGFVIGQVVASRLVVIVKD